MKGLEFAPPAANPEDRVYGVLRIASRLRIPTRLMPRPESLLSSPRSRSQTQSTISVTVKLCETPVEVTVNGIEYVPAGV